MRTRVFILFFAVSILSFRGFSQDGATIYKKNCAVCHTIGKGKMVGPDLIAMNKKHDIKWLQEWIKSSQTLIKVKKDVKAIQIFNDNNQMVMPDQALSDDEIKTLIAFVGDETFKLEQPAVVVVQTPIETTPSSLPISNSSSDIASKTVIYILLVIIAFLTTMLFSLSKVIKNLAESHKR
jgi:cytochrome c551/c552